MAVTTFPDTQDGYRGFAKFIAPQLDTSTGLFKRFSKLNSLNLLYMQAELVNIEQELQAIAYLDEHCGDATRMGLGRNVAQMKRHPHNAQWAKILEARTLLKAYNKALREQANLANMGKAREYDRNVLQHWLLHSGGGNSFLTGAEAQPWMPNQLNDLVAISSRGSSDTFSRWAEEKIVPWLYWLFLHPWKKPVAGQENTRIVYYPAAGFARMARVITVCFSTLLPSIAVLALYFIDKMSARLGAIIGFSAMFSLVLALFTNARSIEIFTATASFAAVQVVFVGGTNSGDYGQQLCNCTL